MIGVNKKSGFSFIEVIFSVVLFSAIILSATQIFKMVIDSQRSALATQNVQESLKYFLEVVGKEMRMAQRNLGRCSGIPNNSIFFVSTNASGDMISFRNYYDQCVSYYLAPDIATTTKRFVIFRDTVFDFISPGKINISSLRFIANQSTSTQAIITINLKANAINEAQFKSEMTIQTSLSSRYYKD